MEVRRSPNFNLVIHSSEKDLSTVKLLSEKTKKIAEVAYSFAVKGRVASLTALLIVAAKKVNNSVLELRDSDTGRKEKVTIYECLIREALALGCRTRESENSERRKLLVCEIELLQLFGVVAQSSGGGDKKVTSPLILAAQRGDGGVIQLLLKTNIHVNDADADGNSALHWILGLSRLSCPLQIRIVLLLIEHGALVSQRNKLGLTAFHIAAGNGKAEALEYWSSEPASLVEGLNANIYFVHEFMEYCPNASTQRAIDLATSQEMRYILQNPTTISLINHAFPYQLKCMALELADEETTTKRHTRACLYLYFVHGSQVVTPVNARNVNSSTKADVCKYFNRHQGCVRGAKCFNSHCEESQKVEGEDRNHSSADKLLKRKIFVGRLPPSVDSDALRKLCEEEFGSVEDAVVIVTQIENKIQSRGFGLVTYSHLEGRNLLQKPC
ncbi:putative transcription factor C3H family [Rosa chinensis]|uniref:Putative transcription factor C3H family n=1 Tax=Rosa chinensis TaxID=74649 RepID=A0A2P6S519_ROSCH|nr:putative transcription factor C3H family [Rosa chinensis]